MKRILVLLLLVLALAVPGMAQDTGVTIIGGDEAQLRDFLQDALGYFSVAPSAETSVYVGALPEELPFELALTDEAHLIGSMVSTTSGHTWIQVFYSAATTPEEAVASIGEALGEGWTEAPNYGPPPGGFVAQPLDMVMYCSEDNQIFNAAARQEDDHTAVRINWQSAGDSYACGREGTPPSRDAFSLLPKLQTPEGVELRDSGMTGGGGSGGGPAGRQSANASTVLVSELPVEAIAPLYDEQIAAQGWEQVSSRAGEGSATSRWTYTDEAGMRWAGVLTLTENPVADGEFFAWLMIEQAP